MFFFFSKTLSFFLDPGNILLIALIVVCVLLWTRFQRFARWWLTLTVLFAMFLATVPAGRAMFNALENRFETAQPLPDQVEGVIVLGGVVNQFVSDDRKSTVINGAVERLTAFAALADRYPDAKLVFTGGSGVLTDQSLKEADFAGPILQRLGIKLDRVTFENQSRNTAENASLSRALVSPTPQGRWVLVTSAFHMPRAAGVFRQDGWNVIPYPVDYATRQDVSLRPRFGLREGMNFLASALREWTGLTFYWLTGRTNEFFPGPQE